MSNNFLRLLASVYLVSVLKLNLKFEMDKQRWLRLTTNSVSIPSTLQLIQTMAYISHTSSKHPQAAHNKSQLLIQELPGASLWFLSYDGGSFLRAGSLSERPGFFQLWSHLFTGDPLMNVATDQE